MKMTTKLKMKLKKGDHVQVIQGKDIGKRGEIARVFPDRDKVIVESSELINVSKKHQKPTRATRSGASPETGRSQAARRGAHAARDRAQPGRGQDGRRDRADGGDRVHLAHDCSRAGLRKRSRGRFISRHPGRRPAPGSGFVFRPET